MGNAQYLHRRPEEPAIEEGPPPTEFTCEICIEPTPPNNKFNNNNVCVHPFCSECISTYIETKVQDNVGDVPCPDLACDKFLDPLTARPVLPPKVFERWCDNLCNSAVQELKTCYCPYPNCSVLVINECGRKPKETKCPGCKRQFCFQCKCPWEAGHKCGKALNMKRENDKKFLEVAKVNHWTKCPGCGHYIERVAGCRSVLCRCGTRFCHQCGRRRFCKCEPRLPYDQDNRIRNFSCESFCNVLGVMIVSVITVGFIVYLAWISFDY